MNAPRLQEPKVRELRNGSVRVEYGLEQYQTFSNRERAEGFAELLCQAMAINAAVTNYVALHAIRESGCQP